MPSSPNRALVCREAECMSQRLCLFPTLLAHRYSPRGQVSYTTTTLWVLAVSPAESVTVKFIEYVPTAEVFRLQPVSPTAP